MKKDPEQEKWWRDFRIPGTKKILKTSSRRKTGNRNQKLSRAARRAEFDHWKGGNSNSFFKRVEIEILLQMFYRLLNIGAWNSRDFSAFFSSFLFFPFLPSFLSFFLFFPFFFCRTPSHNPCSNLVHILPHLSLCLDITHLLNVYIHTHLHMYTYMHIYPYLDTNICKHIHMCEHVAAQDCASHTSDCSVCTEARLPQSLTQQGMDIKPGLFPGHWTPGTWDFDSVTPRPSCRNFLRTAFS